MKLQAQTQSHRPEIGQHGDCHRTAIAIILGLDAKDVPHFCETDDMELAQRLEREWLGRRGLQQVNWVFPGELTKQEILERTHALKDVPVIVLGTSARGVNHSVVVMNGEIVCDPATGGPNPHALTGPAVGSDPDFGEWWITLYAVANTFDPTVPLKRSFTVIRDNLYCEDGERGIP